MQVGCKYKWFPDSTGTVKRYVSSNPPLSRLHTRIRWTTLVKEEVNMLELRPVHLVRTVETETRCTSEPSQERRRLCQFSPFISVQMVQNLFQNIDSRKATGADGIPGLLLKTCASVLAPSLTTIFNASLAAGELPQAFKQADFAPVYKSGDRETASNYRPISLLPIVSKLLEKIVSTQLKTFPGQQQSSS